MSRSTAVRALLLVVACVALVVAGRLILTPRDRAPAPSIEPARAAITESAPLVEAGASSAEQRVLASATGSMVRPIRVRVVRHDNGMPLEGARVRFVHMHDGGDDPVDEVRTDEAGIAIFDAGTTETATVDASVPGFASALRQYGPRESRSAHGWHGALAKPLPDKIELRLVESRSVLVRVLDRNGAPIPATEFVQSSGSMQWLAALTDACFAIGQPFERGDDKKRVRVFDPSLAWTMPVEGRAAVCVNVSCAGVTLGCSRIEPSATEVDVRIDTALLRRLFEPFDVRVVDAGEPVVGAQVSVDDSLTVRVRTDEDGRARVHARRNPTTVHVRADGFLDARASVRRPIDGDVVVELARGRRIHGRARGEDGAPLAHTKLVLLLRDPTATSAGRPAPVQFARTTRDGEFVFAEVDASAYHVGVFRDAQHPNDWTIGFAAVDCTAGDALDVEVHDVVPPPKKYPPRSIDRTHR